MKRLFPVLLLALAPVYSAHAELCPATLVKNVPDTTPTTRFSVQKVNGNPNTVVDTQTKLEWAVCPYGFDWNAGLLSCQSSGTTSFTWTQALLTAVQANHDSYLGKQGWRIPNAKELASIVEYKCSNPAINNEIFPGTDPTKFWTNTHVVGSASYVEVVDFYAGQVTSELSSNSHYLRLVRDVTP